MNPVSFCLVDIKTVAFQHSQTVRGPCHLGGIARLVVCIHRKEHFHLCKTKTWILQYSVLNQDLAFGLLCLQTRFIKFVDDNAS